ncbi:MAG: sulfite exporter TauE/SafE family protein [Acetobacteraceae bacterium]
MSPNATDLGLFLAGFASWTISTLSAGGGSILIVAAITALLRGHAIAPVVTFASAVASPARIILFWRFIEWPVVRWYLPGATVGAIVGGWAFAQVSGRLIQVAIGLFLVSTLWQYRLGDRSQSFRMRLPWFVPVSFVSGLTSAIVGASGLLANPFYLNYGLTKERMLATRAVNSLVIQLVKIAAYLAFGVLNWDLVRHGASAGAGAGMAIWLTRPWLHRLEPRHFRKFAVSVMVIAGLLTLWQQRVWILSLVTSQ